MILYFDLATSTGWAAGDHRGVKGFGTFELARTGDLIAPFAADARRHIVSLREKFKPDLIGFEAPILRPYKKKKGGGSAVNDTPNKLRKLYGLALMVELDALDHGVKCTECVIGSVRLHFMGRGYPNASEAANLRMRNLCRARGWNVKNSDEANALAGLDYLLAIQRPLHALQAMPLWQAKSRRSRTAQLLDNPQIAAACAKAGIHPRRRA